MVIVTLLETCIKSFRRMRIHLYPTTFSFTDTTFQNMNSMLESLIFTFHSIDCLVIAFFFFFGQLPSGAGYTDPTSGVNFRPSMLKNGKGTSDTTTSGSELFRSVRSECSDLQHSVSVNRNQATFVPPLSHQKSLEMVNFS